MQILRMHVYVPTSEDVLYDNVQWNLSNPDTLGTEESVPISKVSVLISEVVIYTQRDFGTAKSFLFINVSSS